MQLQDTVNVNGYPVRLIPYTERRREELDRITKQINDFVDNNSGLAYDDVDKEKRAEWWMAKARILWEPLVDPETVIENNASHWDRKANHFSKEFFMDDDFEYPMLQKTEVFFLNQRLYL